ncbi:MAG: BON domain-containing protein [Phycisphaerae bacterium]
MKADEATAAAIRGAWLEDPRLSAHGLEVTVRSGQVTLAGVVPTFARKRAALMIASRVAGVGGVIDRIDVAPPGLLTDDEVAEGVRRQLEAHDQVGKAAITVSVSNGVVTLRGNVASPLQHVLAEDVAIAAAGVRGIQNLLFVNPDAQREDIARARDLETALRLADGLSEVAIRAAVAGGVAVLSGAVFHAWQKHLAESVAQRMRFLGVRNDIEVRGTGAASPLAGD